MASNSMSGGVRDKPMQVKTNIRVVVNEKGNVCFPATQRPDGSWRKQYEVKAGYNTPELQAKYVPKPLREKGEKAGNVDATDAVKSLTTQMEQVDLSAGVEKEAPEAERALSGNKKTEVMKDSSGFSLPPVTQFFAHLVPVIPPVTKTPASVPEIQRSSAESVSVDVVDTPSKVPSTDTRQDPPKGICSVNKVEEEEDFLKDNSARLYEEIMSGVLTIEEEVRRWNENVAHRALLAELKLLG